MVRRGPVQQNMIILCAFASPSFHLPPSLTFSPHFFTPFHPTPTRNRTLSTAPYTQSHSLFFLKNPYRLKFGLAQEAVVVLIRLLEEIDREYES